MKSCAETSQPLKPGRLSAIQKDVLFLLASIEARGNDRPVPVATLLQMINRVRAEPVFATNFRASCHTLGARQLVNTFRNEQRHLALMLTENGRECAGLIVAKRTEAT